MLLRSHAQYIAKQLDDLKDLGSQGSVPKKTTRVSRDIEEEEEGRAGRSKKRRYKLMRDNLGRKSGIQEWIKITLLHQLQIQSS